MTQIAQKTLRDILQEIEDAISKGRRDDAESKCQQILTQFPESLEAQRLLGEIYLAKGNLEDAQQAFDWVLTNDPENVIAYCDRALISEQQGDYDTALDCYQQAYELSRGNSKIRQLFNKLSQKAGQQGFMLSRAGLARLYMRGDLLAQAMQEWEVVLAVSPDRLDARTGLLETYWREGLYERVEQLAGQILKDVPGCEKALLLLAYVTSLKSMLKAQELTKRAEVLDPDLLMAQDLFSDLLAAVPAEPFLDLLKKPPVLLMFPASIGSSATPVVEPPKNDSTIPAWERMEQRSEQKNGFEAKPSEPITLSAWPESPAAESSVWSDFISATPSASSQPPSLEAYPAASPTSSQWEGAYWNSPDQQEKTEANQSEAQSAPWEMLQNALSKVNADGGNLSALSPEIWATLDQYLKSGTEGDASPLEESLRQDPAPAPIMAQEDVEQNVPSWMSSLNPVERKQMNEVGHEAVDRQSPPANGNRAPAPSTWSAPQAVPQNGHVVEPIAQKEVSKAQSSWPEESKKAASFDSAQPAASEEEDEDSLFGPAWLRSLGAAGFEEEQAVDKDKTIVPEVAAASMPVASPQYDMWSAPKPQEEEASWMNPASQTGIGSGAEKEAQEEPTWMSSLQPSAEQRGSGQEPSWMDSLRQSSESSWLSPSGPSWMDALQQESKTDYPSPIEEKSSAESDDRYAWNPSLNVASDADWRSSYTPDYGANATSWGQTEQVQKDSFEPQDDPLMATLKELEQGLLAQGFVPLEPNTLSSLAHAEERAQVERVEPLQPTREPSLSSALAELGGYAASALEQGKEYKPQGEEQKEPTTPFWTPTVPAAVPLPQRAREEQVAARQEPVTQAPSQPLQPQIPPVEVPGLPPYSVSPTIQPAAYNATPMARPANNGQRVSDRTVREENLNALNFRPTPPAESKNASVVYIDPLLDSELETTMKRPAIRIQPARGGIAKDSSSASPRSRTGERSPGNRVSEPGTSNQERLIIGYQHQLVGDYDEAMQEYRLLIRSAPELLGEIISNVRALLKLAPKYAAGYRVLGDAYMRQGEYLQAMEAYNKALTMAKKK